MKRVTITALLLALSVLHADAHSLIDEVMKMKEMMQESLIQHKTGVVRARHDAERLSIDVTGMERSLAEYVGDKGWWL
ncbi:MAG: hypothetical protein R3Y68_01550 [Rikenellaceae bacterium]